MKIATILCALVVSFSALGVRAEDLAGSSDHPLVTRFPGASIVGYEQTRHDIAWLPSAAWKSGKETPGDWVSGRLTWIVYHAPANHSTLEIYKNYEKALSDAGFDIGFSCKKEQCGSSFIKTLLRARGKMLKGGERWMPKTARYLSAHSDKDNETWVSLTVYERNSEGAPRVRLEIVEANEPRSVKDLGATELAKHSVNYDEASIVTSKRASGKFAEVVELEGSVEWRAEKFAEGTSPYEVLSAYQQQFSALGYTEQFNCHFSACGSGFVKAVVGLNGNILPKGERWSQNSAHYFVAKLVSPTKLSWVSLLSYEHPSGVTVTRKLVVEPDELEFNMISVNSESLAKQIDESGKVAVYGVYFDTDSAELKSESDDTLAEIAGLLRLRPQLQLYVDGHTDSEGSEEHNAELSQKRAQSVVEALNGLVEDASGRLEARGLGESEPVADNASEEGRAWNRRVELVARE